MQHPAKARPVPPSAVSAMADRRRRDVAALEERLRPAPPDVVDDAIELVLEGHGGRATNEARAKAYCIALEGLPAAAIAAGVQAVLQGHVPGIRQDFPPTAPQLAAVCRSFRDRDADQLAVVRRMMLPAPDPDVPANPVVVDGLRDLGESLRRGAAERSLAAAAAEAVSSAAAAAEERARAERISADLAGRDFPPAPSASGATP